MPQVQLLKPGDVTKIFKKFDWDVARIRGSHIIFIKEGNIATLSVQNHSEVARGTLRALIDKYGLTVEEFLNEL